MQTCQGSQLNCLAPITGPRYSYKTQENHEEKYQNEDALGSDSQSQLLFMYLDSDQILILISDPVSSHDP